MVLVLWIKRNGKIYFIIQSEEMTIFYIKLCFQVGRISEQFEQGNSLRYTYIYEYYMT